MKEILVNSDGLISMCRLCLSTDVSMIDIFCFSTKMKKKVADVIMTCAPVQITKCDELPNLICQVCHSQLENIHKFQIQIVQSEKKLRCYLKEFHTSDRQTKPKCFIDEPSKNHLIETTDADITVKRESLEQYEMFDMTVDWKGKTPTNCNVINNTGGEIFLKSELEDEPVDNKSLILSQSLANTVETVFKDSGSETSEDKKIGIDHESQNFTDLCCADVTEYCDKGEEGNKNISVNHKKKGKKLNSYQCELCDYSCTGFQNFTRHKRIHAEKISYQCDVCNKSFSQSFNLNRHKRAHIGEKPYKCDICNKCFTQVDHLNSHKRTHTGVKPYQCDFCNKCFSLLYTLNNHRRTHTGEKPFKCNVCNKGFSQSSHLHGHRRIHTGEKPYQCDVCKKCFSRSDQLNTHKRIHTDEAHIGEKPFKCNVCGKSFSQSSHLQGHKRIHSGEKPYQCDVCKKCFTRSDQLNTHKRIHTNKKIVSV